MSRVIVWCLGVMITYGKTFTLSDWSISLINKYSQVTKRQYRRFAANKYNYCLSLMNCIDYINNMAGVLCEAGTACRLQVPGFNTVFGGVCVAHLAFWVAFFCLSSYCVLLPGVASFSGLSILDWPFGFLYIYCIKLLWDIYLREVQQDQLLHL